MLTVQDLATGFDGPAGLVRVLEGITLTVRAGETVALVGESGCGKTVLALSVLGLLPEGGHVLSGHMEFEGRDLSSLSREGWAAVRGRLIGFVFQEAGLALDPLATVGHQLVETLQVLRNVEKSAARKIAVQLLTDVDIPDPESRFGYFPHQLSGGMRQRVMIALAVAGEPRLLIADEPTAAQDVTTQTEILDLLSRLREKWNMAMLLISHDLGLVAQVADRVEVLYAGRVVESGPAQDLFQRPLHPYTQGLLASVPRLGEGRLSGGIPGTVPSFQELPSGCAFHPRCGRAEARCSEDVPRLQGLPGDRRVACPLWDPGQSPVNSVLNRKPDV